MTNSRRSFQAVPTLPPLSCSLDFHALTDQCLPASSHVVSYPQHSNPQLCGATCSDCMLSLPAMLCAALVRLSHNAIGRLCAGNTQSLIDHVPHTPFDRLTTLHVCCWWPPVAMPYTGCPTDQPPTGSHTRQRRGCARPQAWRRSPTTWSPRSCCARSPVAAPRCRPAST